jgi:predicted nucleotidyltransferase
LQKHLDELKERLAKTYGGRLKSVVLYGSAAVGDHQQNFSDLNVLAVLDSITPAELKLAEPIFRWWRDLENPSPLLMTEEEIRNSADCFPIEFHDIQEQGKVIFGQDLTSGVVIDDRDYRAEVEHELRAKLLRLRQKGAGVMEDRPLLLRLMTDSVSTFCVLFRHALALAGEPRPAAKRDILDRARVRFGIDTEPFLTLLDLREGKAKASAVPCVATFERYLMEIQTVIAAVDRMGEGGKLA